MKKHQDIDALAKALGVTGTAPAATTEPQASPAPAAESAVREEHEGAPEAEDGGKRRMRRKSTSPAWPKMCFELDPEVKDALALKAAMTRKSQKTVVNEALAAYLGPELKLLRENRAEPGEA